MYVYDFIITSDKYQIQAIVSLFRSSEETDVYCNIANALKQAYLSNIANVGKHAFLSNH